MKDSNCQKLEKMDIALFDIPSRKRDYSELKFFLNFLKSVKSTSRFSFSHVESDAPLFPEKTLIENIYLDLPKDKSLTPTENIESLIEESRNPHLMSFFNSIPLKHDKAKLVDDESRKCISLIKAILEQKGIMFIEKPDKFLGKEKLSLFIKALLYSSVTTGKTVVLTTRSNSLWTPYLTKKIYRNDSNQFEVQHILNPHHSIKILSDDSPDFQHQEEKSELDLICA